jgi:hypothetical protein
MSGSPSSNSTDLPLDAPGSPGRPPDRPSLTARQGGDAPQGENAMTLDQVTALEEEQDAHTAEDEAEEAMLAALAKLGLTKNEDGEIVAENAATARKTVICSCGLFSCGAIGIYGHPVPVFQASIEPLYPQSTRDREALALKGGAS